MNSCDFCDEFSGGTANAYAARLGTKVEPRSIECGSFRVLPSLGQLVEGHLLILPVAHYCAVADLPSNMLGDFGQLMQDVRTTLKHAYRECIFFEHGVRGTESGGCGITHAHMHAVPAAADRVLEQLRNDFKGSPIEGLQELKSKIAPDSSYLFFENSLRARYAFSVSHVPSQYLRKLVANEIGNENWDWRRRQHEPEIAFTLKRISPLLTHLGNIGV